MASAGSGASGSGASGSGASGNDSGAEPPAAAVGAERPSAKAAAAAAPSGSGSGEGILLYYKYCRIAGQEAGVQRFYEGLCRRLGQVGRIRVAADGVNATVGGSMAGLREHIAAVRAHPLLAGADIDFKVAESSGAASEGTLVESGFEGLRVAVCKELVSLGEAARSRADPLANGGRHLSPREFHELLLGGSDHARSDHASDAAGPGGGVPGDGGGSSKPIVLVDARNAYETDIGRFEVAGVPLLDPRTRAFSELPAWMDANESQLAGKRVVMYCTGGVRCERASAYLREKGATFQDVLQLRGGIQRYLEEYPDGGLFAGKLFVYDPRGSMTGAAGAARTVGRCLGCGAPHDDYAARVRCGACRQLVLLCPRCLEARSGGGSGGGGGAAACVSEQAAAAAAAAAGEAGAAAAATAPLICELCTERRRAPSGEAAAAAAAAAEEEEVAGGRGSGGRKLRILCLHGFRQGAHQFKARAQHLRHGLSDVAELVFVDAPHLLPLWYKPRAPGDAAAGASSSGGGGSGGGEAVSAQQEQAAMAAAEAAAGTAAAAAAAETEAGADEELAAWAAAAALSPPQTPTAGGVQQQHQQQQPAPPKLPPGVRKRAWLVSPELLALSNEWRAAEAAGAAHEGEWEPAPPGELESQSLQAQAEGWPDSLAALQAALRAHAPIDGLLAFSQGAAAATALVALQERARRRAARGGRSSGSGGGGSGGGGAGSEESPASEGEGSQQIADAGAEAGADTGLGIRFVILISGFLSACPAHARLLASLGPLPLPSLHIFGGGGDSGAPAAGGGGGADADDATAAAGDRTVGAALSEALAAAYDPAAGRRLLRHGGGHDVPRSKSLVAAVREFVVAQGG